MLARDSLWLAQSSTIGFQILPHTKIPALIVVLTPEGSISH